jgi:hypothetical protein
LTCLLVLKITQLQAYWPIDETDWSSEQPSIDFQTTQERQHYSSPGDGHHPLIWPLLWRSICFINMYMFSILPWCPFIIPLIYHQDDWMHNNELSSVQRELIWYAAVNPHFAYLHAKQSNVCLYPRVFLGHQTHHSEATYNLCSDFG